MWFLPALAALLSYLIIPSLLLSAAVAIGAAVFLVAAAEEHQATFFLLRNELYFRILCVKLLTLNGPTTKQVWSVHNRVTEDPAKTHGLRVLLRRAAVAHPDAWEWYAKRIAKNYRNRPEVLDELYQLLWEQLGAAEHGVTQDSQRRLIRVASMWGIGLKLTQRHMLDYDHQRNDPVPEMLKS